MLRNRGGGDYEPSDGPSFQALVAREWGPASHVSAENTNNGMSLWTGFGQIGLIITDGEFREFALKAMEFYVLCDDWWRGAFLECMSSNSVPHNEFT